MIAAVFLSFISGVAATLLYAVYLAARPKSEASANQPSAVGVDLNRSGGAYVDPFYAKTLEPILRNVYGEKHTRH
jgi:hypothetical protein